ncbi:MAG TPA: tetratricopeptide repeat protein [Gemmataceae bacterium]|nr:tetratricopeptide repeat protein [Gemmataceae bacterium]
MKARLLIVIAVMAPAVAGVGSQIAADEKSWVGESVLYTKRAKDIKFGDRVDGKEVWFLFSGRTPIKVREEREGRLRIHDGSREGWVDKRDFVLVNDAPAYFDRRVQANPKDTFALLMRGSGWLWKGEPDKAIQDFNECIRLDPTDSAAFHNRGLAWHDKKEYDEAIKDFDEAIRLDPKYTFAFHNRGSSWSAKKEYDKAIKDYDEAIRLDPKNALVQFNLSLTQMLMRRPEAAGGFQAVLDLQGWKGDMALYAVILGHFAARQAGDKARAERFLKDSAGKLDETWPYPAVKFLRGEIDEPALLRLADNDDKRTQARCYLGLDHLLKGRKKEALADFRWVKVHGNSDYAEYTIAVAELDKLERPSEQPKR